MKTYKSLEVYIANKLIGTLAETKDFLVAFEYSNDWLENGFSISPFSLPLNKEIFVPSKYETFNGLFGVFSDSLPDGWGRLLVDRLLSKNGINPTSVSPLTRLAIVGNSGMGALEYRPSVELKQTLSNMSLDELAIECSKMFETEHTECLDDLFKLGASSGGARPKINYKLDNEDWIVKFPSSLDNKNIGSEEYEYSLCAKKCKIEMTDTRLLPSNMYDGYFATKRFDRNNGNKVHMISVSALLETSHRIPNLDYNTLMQLTLSLTKSYTEVEKLFRLMCFNTFSHNRDDHSKNFSFLYKDNTWQLAPAYDLTFSSSIGGEHATTINGNGANPDKTDLLEVAKKIKMDKEKALSIICEIDTTVSEMLAKYLKK